MRDQMTTRLVGNDKTTDEYYTRHETKRTGVPNTIITITIDNNGEYNIKVERGGYYENTTRDCTEDDDF